MAERKIVLPKESSLRSPEAVGRVCRLCREGLRMQCQLPESKDRRLFVLTTNSVEMLELGATFGCGLVANYGAKVEDSTGL